MLQQQPIAQFEFPQVVFPIDRDAFGVVPHLWVPGFAAAHREQFAVASPYVVLCARIMMHLSAIFATLF